MSETENENEKPSRNPFTDLYAAARRVLALTDGQHNLNEEVDTYSHLKSALSRVETSVASALGRDHVRLTGTLDLADEAFDALKADLEQEAQRKADEEAAAAAAAAAAGNTTDDEPQA